MLHIPGLYLAETDHRGRGIFSSEYLEIGDLIEICPLIIIPKNEVDKIHQSVLHDYYFEYPDPIGSACLALGYGCLYNHSSTPNAKAAYDLEEQCIHIICISSIQPGSEILIDYGAGERKKIWFEEQ